MAISEIEHMISSHSFMSKLETEGNSKHKSPSARAGGRGLLMEYLPNICKARFDSSAVRVREWLHRQQHKALDLAVPSTWCCKLCSGSWEENDKIVSRKLQIYKAASE